jgi:hypothetical protein
LYDGALLEVDADGDIMIPPVVEDAPELDAAKKMSQMTPDMIAVVVRMAPVEMRMGMVLMRRMKTWILKGWRMIIVWWLTTETTITMTTRMTTITMTMRMRMIRAMNTGIAEQNTMRILISVRMVSSVSCWRSYYRT